VSSGVRDRCYLSDLLLGEDSGVDDNGTDKSSSNLRHLLGSIRKRFAGSRFRPHLAKGRPSSLSRAQNQKVISRTSTWNSAAIHTHHKDVNDLKSLDESIAAYRVFCKVLSDYSAKTYTSLASDMVTLAPLASIKHQRRLQEMRGSG